MHPNVYNASCITNATLKWEKNIPIVNTRRVGVGVGSGMSNKQTCWYCSESEPHRVHKCERVYANWICFRLIGLRRPKYTCLGRELVFCWTPNSADFLSSLVSLSSRSSLNWKGVRERKISLERTRVSIINKHSFYVCGFDSESNKTNLNIFG